MSEITVESTRSDFSMEGEELLFKAALENDSHMRIIHWSVNKENQRNVVKRFLEHCRHTEKGIEIDPAMIHLVPIIVPLMEETGFPHHRIGSNFSRLCRVAGFGQIYGNTATV